MNIKRELTEEEAKGVMVLAKKVFGFTIQDAYNITLAHKKEFVILKKDDRVIGYSLIIPISEAFKQKIERNEITEDNLLLEGIYEKYKDWWYVAEVCIDKDECETKDSLDLIRQCKAKIKGKKACAVVVSEEGAILAKFLKMNPKVPIKKGFQGIKGFRPTFYQT